jgi:Putative Ig domain
MSATGGTPPYHWSVATGALPNGLGINAASGMIAGQPAAVGTFGFAVSVQDSSAKIASAMSQMSIQITAAPTTKAPLQISTSSLPNGEVGDSYDSPIVATGGTPPYQWSIASGALPSGLGINSSSGVISGQPSAAGTFSFAVGVQDSSANKSSAQSQMSVKIIAATNSPTPSPTPAPAPAAGTYYGSGIGSDGLGNTTIGPNQNKLSYRIRVQHTGFISAVQPYLVMDHIGYWGGTSGSLLVSIQTDDGSSSHNPSGQKLTSYLLNDPDSVPTPARYFPTITFSAPASVTAGELYHIVFENTDPNPSVNYVSVDALYQAAAPMPSQPTMSDTDCAVLLFSAYSDGTVWKPRQGYTPIVQMDFEDGFTEGFGYMEVWVGAPEAISGTASVREAFTVSGTSDTVSSVAVRVARMSGSGALTLRLETGDGTLIEQGTVPASSVPIGASATYAWVSYKFSSQHTLAVGQSYHLVLQSPSSTVYQAYPIRKGSDYGYNSTTFFPDGYAQFLQSGTWVGWTQWGVADRTDGDLQFYFAP